VYATRLEAIPLFAALPPEERELVGDLVDPLEVPAGHEVATQGAFAYSFFAIEEGTAEVRVDEQTVARLGPGDVFGEIALLRTGRRTAAVVSTSPMKLFSLFEQDFREIESQVPTLARELRRQAGERLAVLGRRPEAG
jgi:CRP/FNR family transcriptional regulator, cyclic AMP receptor protein